MAQSLHLTSLLPAGAQETKGSGSEVLVYKCLAIAPDVASSEGLCPKSQTTELLGFQSSQELSGKPCWDQGLLLKEHLVL